MIPHRPLRLRAWGLLGCHCTPSLRGQFRERFGNLVAKLRHRYARALATLNLKQLPVHFSTSNPIPKPAPRPFCLIIVVATIVAVVAMLALLLLLHFTRTHGCPGNR